MSPQKTMHDHRLTCAHHAHYLRHAHASALWHEAWMLAHVTNHQLTHSTYACN